MMDDDRFDGLYLNVAQTTRGIEPLLDTVFSFLRRKTDFFAGPPGSGELGTEAAIQKVHEVLQKHADIYRRQTKSGSTSGSQTTTKTRSTPPKKAARKEQPVRNEMKEDEEGVLELGDDGGFDVSTLEQKEPPVPPPPSAQASVGGIPNEDEEDKEQQAPPPVGNGGSVDGKYVWTQTLSELNVVIPLPDNTRGRDLNVSMTKKHIKVGLKAAAGEWILNGALKKPIICDDSFWTVEDGNRLVVNLQKLNDSEWWDGVVEGDPTIDVKTIQPETSSLADLDGDLRTTVEKMMFDNRQKAMGLPTSDEQQKLEMLEKFKQQHPEMDFSNAKFS